MIPGIHLQSFKDTFLRGRYNLLLGSGISLDSMNAKGEPLRSSETLRKDLCALKGAAANTSLSRVYPLLTPAQVQEEIIARYSGCIPGSSLANLFRFLWLRIFSFNIDDVLENLNSQSSYAKQPLVPLNFHMPFEPTPDKQSLQCIHLHGWVRQPDKGFVFSTPEYTRIMKELNPWMHLLSEILATESFIIAGTSLNEIDLEYYLSHRTSNTPRRDRGPSFLIEPNPDVVTRSDCERYGLILIEATFGEFMDWLYREFPTPPSVSDLLVPDIRNLFTVSPSPKDQLLFFSDFKLISAAETPLSESPSPFLYGREPDWEDMNQHVDIPRSDYERIKCLVDQNLSASPQDRDNLIIVMDEAGSGKTTIIKRVAHSFVTSGRPVFALQSLSRVQTKAAINCLSKISSVVLLLVDGLADHAEQILELLQDPTVSTRIIILATERLYRRDLLALVFSNIRYVLSGLSKLSSGEARTLIERYRSYGLVGAAEAISSTEDFASKIKNDLIAIAVCKVLNDFRPLDSIVDSLWKATRSEHQLPYLCVALASHCYAQGLKYSMLQSIAGSSFSISDISNMNVPLGISKNIQEDDYVVPLNSVISERVLLRSVRKNKDLLYSSFTKISSLLASLVNRKAIMSRSPEARLAQRLFDADKVVRPLLGASAEKFYVEIKKEWEWNSRYWEQRALLCAEVDLETAIQYARHAVSIEQHPFTLTTLGTLLFRQMEVDPSVRDSAFEEAFRRLKTAINYEKSRSRYTVHPFSTVLNGTYRYIHLGGELSYDQSAEIRDLVREAQRRFGNDPYIGSSIEKLNFYI